MLWEVMECRVRDINVHYNEVGTGRPMLILHGGGFGGGHTAMAAFEPLFRRRRGWRRLYPDLPGHGKTPVPTWLLEHDDVLDLVLEFIDAVAPGERFAVHGWSWGGYLARGVVHHRPSQLVGVMLNVPSVNWGAANEDLPAKQVVKSDPQFLAELRPEERDFEQEIVVQSLPLLETLRSTVLVDALPADPAIWRAVGGRPFTFDPGDLPEICSAPALFVTGRQDGVAGYKQAWSILEDFPRGTFAVLDRAGHWVGAEQPALLHALANEWLDRVEEYAADSVSSAR